MRRRFPLLLKKRGRRRTGSPFWAAVSESLYYAMFVIAGAIGLWWSLSDVLLPEWRLAARSRGFQETSCLVRGQRVSARPGLAEKEFCPELEVEFEPQDADPVRVWTRYGVGRDTPSHEEAQAALRLYKVGQKLPCWYDPEDPQEVLLSVRRRWWPWLVLSIPVSLMMIGATGIVRMLVFSQTSPERRSARIASGMGLSEEDVAAPRPMLASGLPPFGSLNDSPGVERAHRLPADGAGGWRVVGMATLCLVWNALVALFAYQIGVGYLSVGVRSAVAVLIAAPLAVIGWRMTLSAWRDARGSGGGGATRIEVDHCPLIAGEPGVGALLQYGPARLRELTVSLVCDEIATYRQGTDTRTATAEVARRVLHSEKRIEAPAGELIRRDFEMRTPTAGPHSFVSANNEIRWSIEVTIVPVGRPEVRRRFPLCVYPPAIDRSDAFVAATATLGAPG
ncbi:hypothetical protein Pla108_21690 [Botrimarina colliarenosi]|uniref:DUF3592 domain-containing protein n=1 Tax=Botrimarina colliarenosi TaxID=2528001 RepID=A0A5C6ADG7_9BACT|nr:DUF3592 domain-containing protein [Botrimarina colliarenosi]TWT98014.1 hypothetical protein Pla108_21690 [Botrimarina colliarenosi]